jgi:aspartate kinase
MSTLVLKFGGTSVGTVELIKSAAQIIKKEYDNGHNLAVVVSAMSGTTNDLINFVNNINAIDDAEYDVVVSSGEQITSGLMSLALQEIGIPARSWLGWQLPIITSGPNKNSIIKKIIEILLQN